MALSMSILFHSLRLKVFKTFPGKIHRSLLLIILIAISCKPIDIEKEIKISIDFNIFKTFVSFRFADAATGELIGKTGGTVVTLSFGGRDAAAVVTQTGDRLDRHTSVLGMISVALDPFDPYEMVPGNPVVFSFKASAPGYYDTQAVLTISRTGTHVCLVSLQKTGTSKTNPQQFVICPGELVNGYLPVGFRMMTPGNLFGLECPDSVLFEGAGGETASGPLTVRVIRYNRFAETAAGGNQVMRFSNQGTISSSILDPETIIDFTLQSTSPGLIVRLPEKPVTWWFPVKSNDQMRDSLPVWRFNPAQNIWESAGYANIVTDDTSRLAYYPLRHFSLYAAGELISTRPVRGDISFTFTKPFLTQEFPGKIFITDALTGENIQTIPVSLYSGLSIPVSLDLPEDRSVNVKVQAVNSDYAFSSQPISFTIAPEQTTFSESLILTPLKCRLSGTVEMNFPAGFTNYPVPAILQVLDATMGNLLLSKSISISATGFSTDFSAMVYDNHAIHIKVIPSSLSGDFQSTPSVITEEMPCIVDGIWSFSLDPNTCPVQTTASVSLAGPVPGEPLPVELLVLRASDRRLIKKMAVTLDQTQNFIDITATIPKNSPVLLVIQPSDANRPFTVDPVEIQWNNPCIENLNPVFTVTPQYSRLSGSILFTLDPGLLMDMVPVRILTYTRRNDALLSSQDYIVTRTTPAIQINRYTPSEPLYLKIVRVSNAQRFNPVPFKIDIPDPADTPESWTVTLNPTELLPVHFLVRVVCPGGEVLPTVMGYYRIPGEDWHEMNIISGSLNIVIELGLTYEVGMILSGVMLDSVFTVTQQENNLTFALEPADCEKMGWGK